MSHEGSAGEQLAELFLSGVSPKKVPPLLLQPPTFKHTLSTVRPPLRTSPNVERSSPSRGPPTAALFLRPDRTADAPRVAGELARRSREPVERRASSPATPDDSCGVINAPAFRAP